MVLLCDCGMYVCALRRGEVVMDDGADAGWKGERADKDGEKYDVCVDDTWGECILLDEWRDAEEGQ